MHHPYREYGIAAKLRSGKYPKGIFWGFYDEGKKNSVRSYTQGTEQFVIAVGQPHKVGQKENNAQNIQNLIDYLQAHFDVDKITHCWGGQHYRPADKLPYIGRKSEGSRIYLATGFSTDGLVYGSLAAKLISDDIAGTKNPFAEFYKASRLTPVKSAKKFVMENLNVAAQYLKNLPSTRDEPELENFGNGERTIISKDGHKIAARKTETGEVKMWFDLEGHVLEGPALEPLHRIGNEKEKDGR